MRRTWFALIMALLLAMFPIAFCEDGTQAEIPEAPETADSARPEESLPEEIPEETPTKPEEAPPAGEDDPPPVPGPADEPEPVPADDPAENPTAGGKEDKEKKPGKAPAPAWDAELSFGQWSTVAFSGESTDILLLLKVDRAVDALLRTEGLPVSVTLTTPEGKVLQAFEPASENGVWTDLEASLRLNRGEYVLCVRKTEADAKGTCRLLVAEAEAPAVSPEADEPVRSESIEILPETPAETEKTAGTESVEALAPAEAGEPVGEESVEALPEAPAEADEPAGAQSVETLPETSAEEPAGTESVEVFPEAPAEDEESAEAGSVEITPDAPAAAESVEGSEEEIELEPIECEVPEIHVRVTAAMAGTERPGLGTEVVLTAEVTGCDPRRVNVEWQYSPDGGVTAVTVEGAHSLEYRYTVTWENQGYLWRAVVTDTEAASR